jgi:chromosome partitioning protein
MWTIAVVNRKGGVGKSTTAVNLGHALARAGRSVLAIDCDSQRASLTTWLGPADLPETLLADALVDPKRTSAAIVAASAAGVDLICGGARTLEVERDLTARGTMPIAFRRIFRELGERYDYVLLDCPPALGGVVVAALVAVDEVLIPVTGRGMSLDAVVEVLDLLEEIVDGELRPSMPVLRTLLTEYDSRLNLAQAVRSELTEQATQGGSLQVFNTAIRRNERLAECYGARKSIFDVDPRAYGAADYAALAAEVLA